MNKIAYRGLHALAWGLVIEPLAHPKPGAVTRISSHGDKDVYSFAASGLAGLQACITAAHGGCAGFFARGLRVYLDVSRRLGVETNTQLGSIVLLLPLCRAYSEKPGIASARQLAVEASRLVVQCTGREDAVAYYRALEELSPSHLGRYEGPVPGVGSGRYPHSLVSALRAASWDLVHGELLNSYPATLEAYETILSWGGPFSEESILAALLVVLARYGDTLIARKWGFAAYKRALYEARRAAAAHPGRPRDALEWLDRLWRPRGWNPGAALDVVSAAAGLAVWSSLEGIGRS